MDPEMRRLLQNIAENTKENNVLLHKMHRSMRWAQIFRITYWVVIIGFAVGAYYLIQPYVEALGSTFGFKFGDSNRFLEFWRNFR